MWYRNNRDPVIEITGRTLCEMFVGEYEMTMPTMEAIVRLFQEMDADMYEKWSEKRWRHFMPVQFALESVR